MTNLFFPFQKATLLIPSGPNHDPDRKHLFIVLTNPSDESEKKSLLVSISTLTGYHCDMTCVLDKGDHDFIHHKSYVDYYRARIEETEKLINGVQKGLFETKRPIRETIFKKIVNGLSLSPRTPLKIKQFYEDFS